MLHQDVLVYDASSLSFDTFRREVLAANRIALVRGASSRFRIHESFGKQPNSDARDPMTVGDTTLWNMKQWFTRASLTGFFGSLSDKTCPVYVPNRDSSEGDSLLSPETKSLDDILRHWTEIADSQLPFHDPNRWYLMNWHFQQEAEQSLLKSTADSSNTPALYGIPDFLGPDLMHWYFLQCRTGRKGFGDGTSDYRFVYMGIESTWTPLHHDVFGSFSWSLNVHGKKLWYFFTDASEERITFPLGGTPPDMRVVSGVELLSFVQEEGDLVFVPCARYHQVHNIEGVDHVLSGGAHGHNNSGVACPEPRLVISINHNWMSPDQLLAMMGVLDGELREFLSMLGEGTRDAFSAEEFRDLVDRALLGGSNWNPTILRDFVCTVVGSFATYFHSRVATSHGSPTSDEPVCQNDAWCGGRGLLAGGEWERTMCDYSETFVAAEQRIECMLQRMK